MSLPLPPPVPEDDPRAPAARDPTKGRDDVERTEAFWHPGMSRATYIRLLRLLFDPPPDDGGGGSLDAPGGRAA